MRPPPQSLSIYDPKHVSATGRQTGKSVFQSMDYAAIRRESYQSPDPFPTPVYTQEQHDAFAAAIEGLCKQYPVYGWNRGARKRNKARFAAIKFARQGQKNEAFVRAIYGAIPKDALRAVETLIYG